MEWKYVQSRPNADFFQQLWVPFAFQQKKPFQKSKTTTIFFSTTEAMEGAKTNPLRIELKGVSYTTQNTWEEEVKTGKKPR